MLKKNSPNFSPACEITSTKAELYSLVQAAESRQPINFKCVGPSKGINSAMGILLSDFNGNVA